MVVLISPFTARMVHPALNFRVRYGVSFVLEILYVLWHNASLGMGLDKKKRGIYPLWMFTSGNNPPDITSVSIPGRILETGVSF